MVLSTTESLVLSALRDLSTQGFADIEVALRMFYLLGEVIVDKVSCGERRGTWSGRSVKREGKERERRLESEREGGRGEREQGRGRGRGEGEWRTNGGW